MRDFDIVILHGNGKAFENSVILSFKSERQQRLMLKNIRHVPHEQEDDVSKVLPVYIGGEDTHLPIIFQEGCKQVLFSIKPEENTDALGWEVVVDLGKDSEKRVSIQDSKYKII